jgi:hypothetical protein
VLPEHARREHGSPCVNRAVRCGGRGMTRHVLGVQCGKGEMVREYCGADEAIEHAYPVTQMEAFKPCQCRPGNGLGATGAGGCASRVSGQSMSSDRCMREGGSSSKSGLRIRLRCHSLSTIICAKHTRRVLPMSRSTHGFCHAEYRVLSTSVIPRVSDSLPKGNAVAAVQSCRRYYGAASHGNASTNG